MNIKDLKAALPYLFKAQVTPFLWGHGGLGKSSVVSQVAQELGYKFFPFYLGTQSDLGDILGLQEFVRDDKGRATATAFAPPEWLVDTIKYCNENPTSGAIIFLDEFNRARKDILQGMFSLALDKTFHTVKLPSNCYVVAAGNPPGDHYNVTDIGDTALMGRFAHVKFEPTFQEWVTFAKDSKFEDTLISFLQEQPDLLEEARGNFNLPVTVDRRSYERLNKLFKAGTPEGLLDQLMLGIIGAERLVAYKAHLKSADKALTAHQVLSGDPVSFKSLTTWSNPIDIKSSLLSTTSDNVLDALKAKGANSLTEVEGQNLTSFIEVLPRDVAYSFLKRALKESYQCFMDYIRHPEYESRLAVVAKEAKGAK